MVMMKKGDIYRACASVMVFRYMEDGYEFLLIHKPRKRDDWQLPQGGVEKGESSTEAALRELKEEAGITAEAVGKSDLVYQYDFPSSYRRFRPDNVCGQRIEFIFAILKEGEKVQVDENEIDGHIWVLPEQESSYIKRKEYLDIVRKLLEEGIKYIK